MGIDFLDFTFRLEKSFDVKLPFPSLFQELNAPIREITAGDVHAIVCRQLVSQGRAVPASSWHRVQLCAANASGTKVKLVKPESRLIADLGFS